MIAGSRGVEKRPVSQRLAGRLIGGNEVSLAFSLAILNKTWLRTA